MAAERADAVGRAEDLDEVILAYVEAVEAGQSPDRAAWLARYPELADELAAFFADQDRFSSVVAPISVSSLPPTVPYRGEAVVLDADPPLAAGCVVGAYELLDEIASGGMGLVYKARHQALGRVVALKMIRTGNLAPPEDVARFRREAEATANLDHPNIVPIYDVGEHEGQPYFTMKLIEGGSFGQHLAQSPPVAIGELVTIMAQVARAVHHAHQRGILHRDLKPANILLDRRGEPHVTDFGLATHLPGAGASTPPPARGLTQKGIAVGTPGYMAPEQANGPKSAVTVAADVYSLGAVLYECLTGRPPFRAATALETLVQVLECQPPRPRALNRAVPRDLETICLKCLEKDPARRYASAEELADELQRYLDGEPIRARAAGPAERLWRWCRRSPVVAGLAAGLVFAVAISFLLVTVLWQLAERHAAREEAARESADAERRRAEDNWRQAEAERARAEAERRRAEASRREAEGSFQQAHQIVDRICLRLSEDRLSAFPGLQPLRKEILQIGLKYYQDFVAQRGNDPTIKADLARAHFALGNVNSLIGPKRDALASYDQARKIYEELLADEPTNATYREQLARTCLNAGCVLEAVNDRKGALATYERCRELLEGLDRENPNTPKFLSLLGMVYNNLGNVNRGLNRLDDSHDAYEQALKVQERWTRAEPDNPRAWRELAVVYVNVAILHGHRGDQAEANRWHEKARDLRERLHKEHPLDREIQHDLALSCRSIGDRLVREGNLKDGLATLERGHGLMEKVATADKRVTEYQWELALSHRSLARARRALAKQADAKKDAPEATRNRQEAVRSYNAAIDLLAEAHRLDPSGAVYTRDLAATLFDVGFLLSEEARQQPEAALRAYGQAADLYRELARAGADADALARLAETTRNMGHVRRDILHRPEDALTSFNESREARERLVRLRPDEPHDRNDLAAAWFNIAQTLASLKRRDEETCAYEQSRDIREQLVKKFPQEVGFHADLGTTLVNLGITYGQTGRVEDSLTTLRRAVEEKRLAFTALPQSPDYRRGLNNAYGALAEVERVKGKPSASATAVLERRELWPEQPEELYRIARELAQTAAAVGRDQGQLSAEQQGERTLYLDQALETMRQAIAGGFKDGERLAKDADFAALRPRDDFQKLLAGLKK
jgi:serine/threonine-protein kinase